VLKEAEAKSGNQRLWWRKEWRTDRVGQQLYAVKPDAGKLGQKTIPRRVDESGSVLLYQAVNYFAIGQEFSKGRLFIRPHQAAVAVHVGIEDGGKPTFHFAPLAAK
jgi:hypothetical protein